MPSLHLFFEEQPVDLGNKLIAHQVYLLDTKMIDNKRQKMRRSNPEWDFMSRTFTILALLNQALREPQRQEILLRYVDEIIEDTIDKDKSAEHDYFLLPYVDTAPFQDAGAHSLFIDGEIAIMLAARQIVDRSSKYDSELNQRIRTILDQMQSAPTLSGESYPDECWTFVIRRRSRRSGYTTWPTKPTIRTFSDDGFRRQNKT